MRLLPTAALLALSLTFTVGGVAIVGRADPADQTPSAAPPAAAAPVIGQCKQPEHHEVRISPERFAKASDTIELNTRGYNYADPGLVQMDPTGRAKTGAGEVPPAAPSPEQSK
jgi:hypothetical protein